MDRDDERDAEIIAMVSIVLSFLAYGLFVLLAVLIVVVVLANNHQLPFWGL